MPEIVALYTYPVKGCAAVAVPGTGIGPMGLAHDRTFMVTGPDGVFRSQRRDPALATIRPEVGERGALLTLHAPGRDPHRLAVRRAPATDVTMFGRPYRGMDQGDAVAAWLSDVLGVPSRLVRVPPEHDRVTDGEVPGSAAYADGGAVHVLSVSTMEQLNRRLRTPLSIERFRPNIVLDGWPVEHSEDVVRRMTVGDVRLAFAKVAIRCAVTMVDQQAGRRAGPEPLRTLATYRSTPDGIAFGAKFSVLRPGYCAVGDEVLVTAVRDAAGRDAQASASIQGTGSGSASGGTITTASSPAST